MISSSVSIREMAVRRIALIVIAFEKAVRRCSLHLNSFPAYGTFSTGNFYKGRIIEFITN